MSNERYHIRIESQSGAIHVSKDTFTKEGARAEIRRVRVRGDGARYFIVRGDSSGYMLDPARPSR